MPQTTEILRLLRDNSIESKKLAIFMIGKFKLSDMLPEVCECLNFRGLETDAYSVLSAFGNNAVDELIRFYLVSSGNIETSKTILRLLGKTGTKESPDSSFPGSGQTPGNLKKLPLNVLLIVISNLQMRIKTGFINIISDIVGIMTWNLSAKICLEKNNDTFLLEVIKKEINRWKDFFLIFFQ